MNERLFETTYIIFNHASKSGDVACKSAMHLISFDEVVPLSFELYSIVNPVHTKTHGIRILPHVLLNDTLSFHHR
jgi:hypothetical protein